MASKKGSGMKFPEPKNEWQKIPQCYKDVVKILKTVKSCSSNIKTALFNSRHRGKHFKTVSALSCNVLKHSNLLEKVIEETMLMKKEEFPSKEIVAIMIYELMLGKGTIPCENTHVYNLMKYYDDIKVAFNKLQSSSNENNLNLSSDVHCLPRYARINTLVTTVPYVLKDLKKTGFKEVTYADDISENEYLEILKNLKSFEFVVDHQFKDLLVFFSKENLTHRFLYEKGHLLLQDKSSYIPVHVLDPEPGSVVIDACAAPGMKSLHLAARMKNKGILYTYERCNNRFKILLNMLDYGNVKIAKTLCQDFSTTDPNDRINSSVNYILLDPSCSGTGMVNRMNSVTDTIQSKSAQRLQKLAGFQIILLKHAFKFPSVKRVVYSTCSTNEEENEYVVQEALNCFSYSFRLVHIMPEWSVRGSQNYEFGYMCVRANPEKNLTNGFFVAMFERIEDNLGLNSFNLSKNKLEKNFKEEKYNSSSKYFEAVSENGKDFKSLQQQLDEVAVKKKRKKDKKKEIENESLSFSKLEIPEGVNINKLSCLNFGEFAKNSSNLNSQTQIEEVTIKKKKKKKKNKQKNEFPNNSIKTDVDNETNLTLNFKEFTENSSDLKYQPQIEEVNKKKKKKNKQKNEFPNNSIKPDVDNETNLTLNFGEFTENSSDLKYQPQIEEVTKKKKKNKEDNEFSNNSVKTDADIENSLTLKENQKMVSDHNSTQHCKKRKKNKKHKFCYMEDTSELSRIANKEEPTHVPPNKKRKIWNSPLATN